jgi:hypothetical protein
MPLFLQPVGNFPLIYMGKTEIFTLYQISRLSLKIFISGKSSRHCASFNSILAKFQQISSTRSLVLSDLDENAPPEISVTSSIFWIFFLKPLIIPDEGNLQGTIYTREGLIEANFVAQN